MALHQPAHVRHGARRPHRDRHPRRRRPRRAYRGARPRRRLGALLAGHVRPLPRRRRAGCRRRRGGGALQRLARPPLDHQRFRLPRRLRRRRRGSHRPGAGRHRHAARQRRRHHAHQDAQRPAAPAQPASRSFSHRPTVPPGASRIPPVPAVTARTGDARHTDAAGRAAPSGRSPGFRRRPRIPGGRRRRPVDPVAGDPRGRPVAGDDPRAGARPPTVPCGRRGSAQRPRRPTGPRTVRTGRAVPTATGGDPTVRTPAPAAPARTASDAHRGQSPNLTYGVTAVPASGTS